MPETEIFINKYVSVTPETWKKLREYAEKPENRRPPGHQAGMILKDFLDNTEKEIFSCSDCDYKQNNPDPGFCYMFEKHFKMKSDSGPLDTCAKFKKAATK